MKNLLIVLCMMISSLSIAQKNEIVYLWPGQVPGETKPKNAPVADASKNDGVYRIAEITNPAMEVYRANPQGSNKAAVIVCPGGGYNILAWDKEGTEIAAWLNKQGITAFVLQYRVPQKKQGALQDIQRALSIVRSEPGKYNIDPGKIGVIGFSAGGSLSARASTRFMSREYKPIDNIDSVSCKPDFAMLIYPAYLDQGPELTLTPELTLSKEVCPMFLFQTADDPYGNSSIVMAGALRKQKIPVELHLMPKGGHGYGLRSGIPAAETWPVLAEKWLKTVL
ncbi:MAG TPA: alpha/beta hydrolase [Bacteroidales bacterium]|nr:alpha/beta hydrolase [Bacteroidales bacterium]